MTSQPMLASAADRLPVGPAWTYEIKWDGYRARAVREGDRVRLISRNQKDLTRDYPSVVAAIAALDAPSIVLDGEIVALDATGRPSFQALQHRLTAGVALAYYAFDLSSVNLPNSTGRSRLGGRHKRGGHAGVALAEAHAGGRGRVCRMASRRPLATSEVRRHPGGQARARRQA